MSPQLASLYFAIAGPLLLVRWAVGIFRAAAR